MVYMCVYHYNIETRVLILISGKTYIRYVYIYHTNKNHNETGVLILISGKIYIGTIHFSKINRYTS